MWYINSRMVLKVSSRFLLVSVICLLAFTSLYAETLGIIDGSDLVVRYDEPLKNAAREVIELPIFQGLLYLSFGNDVG